MGTAGQAIQREKAVGATAFCSRLANAPSLKGLKTTERQLLEVLIGIVNLYDEKAFQLQVEEFQIATTHAFASDYVSYEKMLQEIGRASGYAEPASRKIAIALEATVQSYFDGKEADAEIDLQFLGTLRALDSSQSLYRLHYQYSR